MQEFIGQGMSFLFFAGGLLGLAWWIHGKRVKSFLNDTEVGQAAKKAATNKAIGMIAKWLK